MIYCVCLSFFYETWNLLWNDLKTGDDLMARGWNHLKTWSLSINLLALEVDAGCQMNPLLWLSSSVCCLHQWTLCLTADHHSWFSSHTGLISANSVLCWSYSTSASLDEWIFRMSIFWSNNSACSKWQRLTEILFFFSVSEFFFKTLYFIMEYNWLIMLW